MNNVGELIKKLREKNNISQNKLAELLYIDRTLISKWENGKANPSVEEIIKLSEIFNVSIEELVIGEEYTDNNKNSIKSKFNNFLIKEESRINKLKKYLILITIFVVLIMIGFLGYYFYQTYNKTKVYIVSGKSEKYVFKDSILFMTRGKSYLKLGHLDDSIKKIEIYYENGEKKNLIYAGSPTEMIIDSMGYDGSINVNNFNDIKEHLYINIYEDEIAFEKIKLDFKNDFSNDNLTFDKGQNVLVDNGNNVDNNIPDYIKNNFDCNDDNCKYSENEIIIIYDIGSNSFYIYDNNIVVTYNSNINYFFYMDNDKNFSLINDDNVTFSSELEKEIFEKYMQYINKYLGIKRSE